MGYHEWKSCIDSCLACAAVCNYCASSCTKEEDIQMMAHCIDLDMQCASVCYTAAQLMSMGSPHAKVLCGICAEICDACGTECGKHNTSHCEECAEACLHCAQECRKMAA
ncbi:four-helix bundle copper-binding protein [Pedobacter ginsengisoli]|uniref:four-helix bundle copper-binding protein n=1 Tax=Pedobacter ginsengisoli TaxID=363852 RepID=UPI002551122D|nr:four-helix bundle copper-binding protein [Pedobacter ginsengisoli]